jgi:hypothetical protein
LDAVCAYDAQGRRKSKTVGSATTIYMTDADNREVLEYSGSTGAASAWYAYGVGPNDVLNRMNVTGASRQTLVPDIQGSILATLDASTGALTKTGYQPFGEKRASRRSHLGQAGIAPVVAKIQEGSGAIGHVGGSRAKAPGASQAAAP